VSWARNSQIAALGATAGVPGAHVSQFAVLVAFGPPEPKRVHVSQIVGLAAVSSNSIARVSEVAILGAYRTGVPDNPRRKAWHFDFDGHSFYVLDLGPTGTFLFDMVTGTWCEFSTNGYDSWNMRNGTFWNNRVVAADVVNPIVWALDPDQPLDEEWRSVAHAVTGIVNLRNRKARRQDALRLTASPGNLGEASGATISMRFSDDMGHTWSDYFTLTLTDDPVQELAWRSLGPIEAPGRVFEISDTSGPIRIDGCDAEIEGVANPQPGQDAPP
jgi:hypothetical protein